LFSFINEGEEKSGKESNHQRREERGESEGLEERKMQVTMAAGSYEGRRLLSAASKSSRANELDRDEVLLLDLSDPRAEMEEKMEKGSSGDRGEREKEDEGSSEVEFL